MTRAPSRLSLPLIVAFGLVTLSVLAAQVILSRLFAGIMTYYYAFMLVSLTMLGLASGGLLVQLFPRWFTRERFGVQVASASLAMGIAGIVGTLGVVILYPNATEAASIGRGLSGSWALAGLFWCLFPWFLAGGIVVALVFENYRESFHKLYAVDLLFAAAGAILAIVLLEASTPFQATVRTLSILPMLAAVLFALAEKRQRLALVFLALTAPWALVGQFLSEVPTLARPPHLSWLNRPAVLSEWNSVSAIRAYSGFFFTWALSGQYTGPKYPMMDVLIDGIGGTEIVKFSGRREDLAKLDYLDFDLTALAHALVPVEGRQLIIGPGGGVDILQAVRTGRTDVSAVEINPLMARVVNEDLGAFSGRPYQLPGVKLFLENGRTFIKRSTEKWDLASLTWVDTGGSATALAFSENYLYTVEAYREFLEHLTPNGFFVFMRALGKGEIIRIDSMRGLAVAWQALASMGIAHPENHILVTASESPFYGRAMCFVLLKRSPLTADDVRKAEAFTSRLGFNILWAPPVGVAIPEPSPTLKAYTELVRDVMTRTDRAALFRDAPFEIAPATDDNPFYFVERARPGHPAGLGVKQLRTLVLSLLALAVPFLLLPLIPTLRRRTPLGLRGVAALLYFCAIGVAFMLVEIELFHVFALLLGSPTLTLSVVLTGLLVASGLGSLAAGRLAGAPPWRLALVFLFLVGSLLAFVYGRESILGAWVSASLPMRVAATLAIIAPMGFAMGLPMTLGIQQVAGTRDLMLWGWALNGVCSVLASAGAIYLAIHIGTRATFAIGAGSYALAGVLLWAVRVQPVPTVAKAYAGPAEAIVLLVEGLDAGVQFFQALVVEASEPDEAIAKASRYLQQLNARLIDVDPAETRVVKRDDVTLGPGAPEAGIVAQSGRVYAKPDKV